MDINEPMVYDFEQRDQAIKMRQALLAQAMRERAGTGPAQGQMVSGHFVAPSILEHLSRATAPMLLRAGMERIAKEQAEYNRQDQAAGASHVARRPTGVQGNAVEDAAGNITGTQSTRPTSQQVAAWAQEGTAIPSRRGVMEKLLQDVEVNEPIREEARAARREDREDRQTEASRRLVIEDAFKRSQLEQRAEEARQRSEDTRLGIEQRREAARQHAEAMRALGELKAGAANAPKPTKMTDSARRDLDSYESMRSGLATGIKTLEGASGNGMGWVAGVMQNLIPGGQSLVAGRRDKATNDAIQQITYTTDEIRHGRFGSALTATEKASAGQYLPTEHDTKDQVLAKAKGLQKLIDLNHSRLRQQGGDFVGTDIPRSGGTPPPTQTKIINGKTYVHDGKGWRPQ